MIKWFRDSEGWRDFQRLDDSSIGVKLLADLYKHAETSLIILLGLSFLYLYLLAGEVPGILLYPWFIFLVLVIGSRLYDAFEYPRRQHKKSHAWWYKNFIFKSFVTAFLWGISSLLFFPYFHTAELQCLQFLLIIGISSGAMTTISPDIRTATTYLFLMISPLLLHFILQGENKSVMLALLLMIYFFLLITVSRNIGRSLIKSYKEEEKSKNIQKKLREKQEELDLIFRHTPISIFYTDTQYRVIDFNLAYTQLFERSKDDMLGMDLRQLPDQRPIHALENGKMNYLGPYQSLKGKNLWIEARAANLVNSEGVRLGKIILIEDKTKEKQAIDKLNYLVLHDDMTSLYNRRGFMERMQQLVEDQRHQTAYSIFFYLDLNRFKTINDTMGHSIGDQLLMQVARRLKILSKENANIIGRLGGDEFGIILPFITNERKNAINRADIFAKSLQRTFVAPFAIEEMFLYVKSSTGIVIIEPSMKDTEEIIRYADIAMYDAKKRGQDTIAHYNATLDYERGTLFELQHELYYALEKNQFEVYYQPIVRIKNDTSYTAEALVRWNHPKRGLLSPADFIPLVIESGMIDKLGWMMIKSVCQQIAKWKSQERFSLHYVSINIDSIQFQSAHFVHRLLEILDTYHINPDEIRLEITENTLISNFEQAKATIDTLKKHGVLCAIDDFGTGYSSLSYLRKFSFSILKIDREFTRDITHNAGTLSLVKSMIDVGRQLGYYIIVEGIETQAQHDLIRSIDSTIYYQGYLFSKPVPADIFQHKFLLENTTHS